ncbi:MAG: DUF3604 domain-containing protein [Acidobacteria bacterium]|nr:DUF3604 domain-containing protein [Acidobacteriota bacterium]
MATSAVYLHITEHTTSITAAAPAYAQQSTPAVKVNPLRDAYYGDLHLHTAYSFDAYLGNGMIVDPDEAYRFAKGEVVQYLGQPVQRREPLDFLAVTDHSESIGVFNKLEDPSSVVSHSEVGKALKDVLTPITGPDGRRNGESLWKEDEANAGKYWEDYFTNNLLPQNLKVESESAWKREIAFANRNYMPGKFTTFIGYEWTAFASGANLHRNVIFKSDSAPYPFTSADSKKPEDLWAWLNKIRKQGYEALAIPHNPNASNGLMYDWIDSAGKPIDHAYAETRQANEPLSEISQNKGTSETHPLLSPNDEFSNYELYDFVAESRGYEGRPAGSYLRDALSRGLILQRRLGVNPYKYGFAGASDLHSGLSLSAQADFNGSNDEPNMAGGRPTKEQAAAMLRGCVPEVGSRKMTAGNLTGVWAESNTRESIYSALRRKETFATTGTKLKFRFFGGWNFGKDLLEQREWIATAYASGVPMGGDLPAKPNAVEAPSFGNWAVKDPNGANLDRVQVIKVWEEDGQQKEKVFDVIWSGNREPDAKTGKLPSVGNTVDLKTGKFTNHIGATELKAVWKDPEFNPGRFAAYYVRVLEIPTARWSTLLAIQTGLHLPRDVPATIQQRGWSSPIWYTPQGRSR